MLPRFSTPPRRVPPSLAIVNLCNLLALVGWGVFGFGMIFVWAFMGNADYSFITFRGPYAYAHGVITDVRETSASESEQKVIAHHYEFSMAGERIRGVSYRTGSSIPVGQKVTVEYREEAPEQSRIAGMRRKIFGPAVSFVGIFPLVGLGLAAGGTRMGMKRNGLLRHGLLAMGKLKEKEATNMTVNKQRVYALTFEFRDRSGQTREATVRTHRPHALEDEGQEPLLYDPENPSRAYLLDQAPSRPRVNEMGELEGRPLAAALAALVPLAVIGANVLVLFLMAGR